TFSPHLNGTSGATQPLPKAPLAQPAGSFLMNFPIAHTLPLIRRQSLLLMAAAALVMASVAQSPASAQGLESEGAIDAIIGSDVKTDEVHQEGDIQRVIDAVSNSRHSAELARKAFNIDSLEIVFVPTINEALAKVLEENDADVKILR